MHRREQGDIGEASAIQWLAWKGALVYTPLFRSPYCDLVADFDGRLIRVEVKTSNARTPRGRWSVHVCTRGGNQSWSGMTKRFDAEKCDFLFAHCGDGSRWFIPASEIQGTTAIALGGDKYGEFQIEPGPPLPAQTD